MAKDGAIFVVLDSSVLINFLAVGRMELLATCRNHAFIVTGHVVGEVQDTDQQAALRDALNAGTITEENIALDSPAGELFVRLTSERRLGVGECAAIAYACTHNCTLAIDDKAARKAALRACPQLTIIGSDDLMVSFIRDGHLDVDQADVIKREWESHHRFQLPFESFRDKLA